MDACLGEHNRERYDGSYRLGASDGRNVQPVHNESAAHQPISNNIRARNAQRDTL
jgi:hypothetical protein